MTGYIMRTFLTRQPDVMMMLMKSLVLPHIEYACVVWNPHTQQDISLLESVQRNYTCRLDGMKDKNYYQRLISLNIYSAERRRDRYLIIYIFKILQNIVPNPGISFKWSGRRGKVLVTPSMQSSIASKASTLLHHSFTRRAPRLFNSLPKSLRNLPDDTTMLTIKNRVDQLLRRITDEPRISGYYPSNSAASNRVEDQIRETECLDEDHH